MTLSGDPLARDTILGIATPPGTSAIGVIRLSGPRAVPIVAPFVRLSAGSLASCTPRHLYRATVVDPSSGEPLDVALVAVMPGPSSYTGDDVVELSCHGNPVLLEAIAKRLVDAGARLAEPGEFTRRAYVRGRLDLLQVEAVAELIGARSERALRLAARQLGGALSEEIGLCRDAMLDLAAALEVALDFPDENVGVSRAESVRRATELSAVLGRLVASAMRGRATHDGLTMMLAGAPNVGKSSLFNRLLGAERAIVAPTPGTTRDLIDGTIQIEGIPVRIVDGAGLGAPLDVIDAEGMRRAEEARAASDLVLVVLDQSRPISKFDQQLLAETEDRERLIIANKCDVPASWNAAQLAGLTCSALTGAGVAEVSEWLTRWVHERTAADGDEGGMVASLRVLEGLEAARQSAGRVAIALGRGVPFEAALVDLRETQIQMGRLVGAQVDDAVLDRIFATFCIGK